MKNIKKIVAKIGAILPALALMVGVISANSACTAFFYQPKIPDAMNVYRK